MPVLVSDQIIYHVSQLFITENRILKSAVTNSNILYSDNSKHNSRKTPEVIFYHLKIKNFFFIIKQGKIVCIHILQ